PSPGAHDPALEPPLALPRLPRLADHRLAGAGGAAPPARADRARHPAALRVPAPVAGGRPGDLGQPGHHAPRAPPRRRSLPTREAARDHPRRGAASGRDHRGLTGPSRRRPPALRPPDAHALRAPDPTADPLHLAALRALVR